MKTSTFQRLAVAGALSLGLAASAAGAQDRPTPPGAPQARAPRGPDRQKPFAEMKQQREQRLHDVLQIRPEQDGAFRALMTALDQPRPERGRRPAGRGGAPHLTAPERLDRMTQRIAERQQRLQKTAAAVKAFYAVLSPEQRKAFDELPLIRIGDRHGPRGARFQGRPPIG